MNGIISIWRDALHQVLDIYERKRGSIKIFFPLLFLFFIVLNIACYWWAIYTAFPFYMQTHEASHYIKLQIPVGFLGALFDSLSFFVTIWIIKRALASTKTSEYVFHLSLDLGNCDFGHALGLFVFSFGGWLISFGNQHLSNLQKEEINTPPVQFRHLKIQQAEKTQKYLLRTHYGNFCSPAHIPSCDSLYFLSLRKIKITLFPKKATEPVSKDEVLKD